MFAASGTDGVDSASEVSVISEALSGTWLAAARGALTVVATAAVVVLAEAAMHFAFGDFQ